MIKLYGSQIREFYSKQLLHNNIKYQQNNATQTRREI